MAETMQVSAQRAWTHLKKYQPLIHELVSRDLKVKYRRSFLGYIWSILNPLLMMLLQSIKSGRWRHALPARHHPL